jgi:hypothetical protein
MFYYQRFINRLALPVLHLSSPWGVCVGACCIPAIPYSFAECSTDSCLDQKVPQCWEVTISGSSLNIDGVPLNGTYLLKNHCVEQEDVLGQCQDAVNHCLAYYTQVCLNESPEGCFALRLTFGGGGIFTLGVYGLNALIWDDGYTWHPIVSFSNTLLSPVDCINSSITLTNPETGSGGGTATLKASSGCSNRYYDYFTRLAPNAYNCGDWWEGETPCWPPYFYNEYGYEDDYIGWPYACVPGSMLVTISGTVAAGPSCEEGTLDGEYELPLLLGSIDPLTGYPYTKVEYRLRLTYCDSPLILRLTPGFQGIYTPNFELHWAGGEIYAEGATFNNSALPPMAYCSWGNLNVDFKWVYDQPCDPPELPEPPYYACDLTPYGAAVLVNWIDDDEWGLVLSDYENCTVGINIKTGDSCVAPSGSFTPPPKEECLACVNGEAAKCWRVQIDDSATVLDNGASINSLDIQLAPSIESGEDDCTWRTNYLCAGVTPGECFSAVLTITENSGTATLNFKLQRWPVVSSTMDTIAEFEEEVTSPLDCTEGNYELEQVGGSGTALVSAHSQANCEETTIDGAGCVLSYDSTTFRPYYNCSGCWISTLQVTISGTTASEGSSCEGYDIDGYYEITAWNNPCEYYEDFEVCSSHTLRITYKIGYYWEASPTDDYVADTGYDCVVVTLDGSLVAYWNIDRTERGTCGDAFTGSSTWCYYLVYPTFVVCPSPPEDNMTYLLNESGFTCTEGTTAISIAAGGTCGN